MFLGVKGNARSISRATFTLLLLLLLPPFLVSCAAPHAIQQKMHDLQGATYDETKEFAHRATLLKEGEQLPSWQQPVDTAAIDNLLIISGGTRAVAATLELKYPHGAASFGPLICYDVATGKRLWTFGRSGIPEDYDYDMREAGDLFLVEQVDLEDGDLLLQALASSSGKTLWQLKLPSVAATKYQTDKNLLLLAHSQGGSQLLKAIDLASGKIRLESAAPWGEGVPGLEIVEGLALFGGKRLTAVDLASGSRVWEVADDPDPGKPFTFFLSGDLIIASRPSGALTAIDLQGNAKWNRPQVTFPDSVMTLSPERIATLHIGKDGGPTKIGLIDRKSGKDVWAYEVVGALQSPLRQVGDFLVFTTWESDGSHHFQVLRSDTGKAVTRTAINLLGNKPPFTPLPDTLAVFGSNVTVVSESGIASLSVPAGAVRWSHHLTPPLTNGSVALTHYKVLNRMADGAATPEQIKTMVQDYSTGWGSNAWVDQAVHSQNAVFSLTSSSTMSAYEASSTRSLAISRTQMTREMQQSGARTAAVLGVLSAVDSIREAQQKAWEEGPTRVAAAQIPLEATLADRLHRGAVQGDYFVKGYESDIDGPERWGVVLVDMKTGHWLNLSTGPGSAVYTGDFDSHNGVASLFAAKSGDGLVTFGLGLDPSRWKKFRLGLNTLMYPSLLGYKIDPADFHPPDERPVWGGSATVIDTKGNVKIPPGKFAVISPFHNGYTGALLAGHKGYGLIDENGRVIAGGAGYSFLRLSEGLVGVKKGEKLGFMDSEGEWVIPPQFSAKILTWSYYFYCPDREFNNGVAMVGDVSTGGFGLIDKRGNWVVEPGEYEAFRGYSEGLAPVAKDGKWGYIDEDFKLVVQPRFKHAGLFKDGRAWVYLEGNKHALIDSTGKVLVERNEGWDAYGLWEFSEGRGIIRAGGNAAGKGEKYGIVDQNLNVVVPLSLKGASPYRDGLAQVKGENGDWFMDRDGNRAFPTTFDEAESFSDGSAPVRIGNLWGYIKRDGTWLLEPQFSVADKFSDGMAVVTTSGKRWIK